MARPPRLLRARTVECALDAPLPMRAEHVFTTIILNLNLFERFFFLCLASQLHFGAEGAQEPS